ncbi:MAG: cyclase family protein [Bacteroidales bacterium]|nr:cyclase family protein [Bacteroidales bacterium]
MRIIDLSHKISDGMPIYPGTPKVNITSLASVEKDGFAVKNLHLSSHIGTHMDAPAHMISEGKTLDQFLISKFTGSACIIPFSLDDIDGQDKKEYLSQFESMIRDVEFVILHTKWSEKWGEKEYFSNFPALDKESAAYLASFYLSGIGIDTISIDVFDSKTYDAHQELLSQEIVIIENLCKLDQIRPAQFKFSAFPLLISDSDGSPVRAMAEY